MPKKNIVPTDNLSLEIFEEVIVEAIKGRPGLGRNSARSAVRHINASWKTREVDIEMAVFRILTAEEEAATAIFYAIKRLKYPLHDKINMKSHLHKLALSPFLRIAGNFFSKVSYLKDFEPKIEFHKDNNRVFISCSANPIGNPGRFEPIPPLHFGVTLNEEEYHFDKEVEEFCETGNIKKMEDFMKENANMRHNLLYGTDTGISTVTVEENYFTHKRRWIFLLLAIYIMIDEHKEHQLFVSQAMTAFQKMISYIKVDELDSLT